MYLCTHLKQKKMLLKEVHTRLTSSIRGKTGTNDAGQVFFVRRKASCAIQSPSLSLY